MTDELPNVILICSEDHGPHFGCHGDPNARTPYLDQLATDGVRFDSHHTTCAICSPGRASLLTGLYPHQNGQINLATHQYGMYRPFANLVSILHEHGYRTGRIGKLHVLPEEAFPFDFVWRDPERISFQHRDVFKTA
ncbi:MAG: sulfatase-like hydrolase/transferase, partial [Planctomycetota bacterium]|nr:sulfatase-like hydrolase/transferase [Planctomycetota bacterium]